MLFYLICIHSIIFSAGNGTTSWSEPLALPPKCRITTIHYTWFLLLLTPMILLTTCNVQLLQMFGNTPTCLLGLITFSESHGSRGPSYHISELSQSVELDGVTPQPTWRRHCMGLSDVETDEEFVREVPMKFGIIQNYTTQLNNSNSDFPHPGSHGIFQGQRRGLNPIFLLQI